MMFHTNSCIEITGFVKSEYVYFSICFFRNKSKNYSYLYNRNLEDSRFFGTQYPFVCLLTGREY